MSNTEKLVSDLDAEATLRNDEKEQHEHQEGCDIDNIAIEDIESAHGFYQAAQAATDREHALSFRQALRLYPASFAWAILISFTIVMEGYNTYLIGNFFAYPSFAKKYGDYDPATKGYLIPASWQAVFFDVSYIGSVVGLLLMGILTQRFGYRLVIIGGLLLLAGINFMTFFAPNRQVLAAALALAGVPTGLFGIVGSAYASEVCPLALRGFLTSFVNICWIIGQLIASGVLVGLVGNPTEWSYRIPFALQWMWIPPLLLLAYFAPDSPYWCVQKGRFADAQRSLKRLSSGSSPTEIRQMLALYILTDKLEKETKAGTTYADCFKGTNLRRTEIACMVLLAQALSGEAFAYGSTYFFTQAGFSSDNAYKLNFGASAVAFVGTCISWILMIWFGRRTLILWGFSAMAIDLLLVGCLTYVDNIAATWTQAALIIIWLGLYSMTLGPQSFGLAAEISSTRLRSQTVAIGRLTYELGGLVTNTVEPYLINPGAANLKGKTAFVWFGTSVLTIIWCIFRMPETKGITYAELDILFEKKTPAWKFKKAKVDVIADHHDQEA